MHLGFGGIIIFLILYWIWEAGVNRAEARREMERDQKTLRLIDEAVSRERLRRR